MPEICRFFGVVIQMNFDDHVPPHFHARYGGRRASISISTGVIIKGSLPPRVLGLLAEWAALHREELAANWKLASTGRSPRRIAPLE